MIQRKATPKVEDIKLYEVASDLDKIDRVKLGIRFPVEIYLQDPFVAKQNPNLGVKPIDIDWEPGISDGPTSARVAVVDYNYHSGKVEEAAIWEPANKKFLNAQNPNTNKFHQVNVWAIVQNTLSFFEDPFVMGRPIPWGYNGNRIIVVPHAGVMRNAFYSRDSKSLQFYYFTGEEGPVYTCLSHDIVAHETGHAILDGIRPYYYNVSSIQTAAFHEFIADLTAILSVLRINEVRQEIADKTDGDLWNDNFISGIAEEFGRNQETYGEAQRYFLRTAHSHETMDSIKDSLIPHFCSLVLTGSMYEILSIITFYLKEKHNPSARAALWRATQHLNRLAFRALDFCPPVDIQFIDYVHAVIKANEIAYPKDEYNYRRIIKSVFNARGLTDLDPPTPPLSVKMTWKYDIEDIASSRTAAYHFLNDNREELKIPFHQDIEVSDIYFTDKVISGYQKVPREIVLTYVWKEDVVLYDDRFGRFQGQIIPLLCGGTIVFDERGNILYFTNKGGTQNGENIPEGGKRKAKLLEYIAGLIREGIIGLVEPGGPSYIGLYQPPIMGKLERGALLLEMSPNFLHRSKWIR
jgi:hypothetical protein